MYSKDGVGRNWSVTLATIFSFCKWIGLTADVRTIGGGLPAFTEGASSCGVFEVSVSIPVVLSGEKSYGWRPPWEVCLRQQVEVRAASAVECRFRLRTSLNPSTWVAGDFGVWDWPAEFLAFNTSCHRPDYLAATVGRHGSAAVLTVPPACRPLLCVVVFAVVTAALSVCLSVYPYLSFKFVR
jgi:hypothetical protein